MTQQTQTPDVPPSGWSFNKLRHLILELDSGVSVSGGNRPAMDDEFGVLKVSAVSNGRFIPHENKVIGQNEVLRSDLQPRIGAVVISRSNSPELVGDSALIQFSPSNLFLPDKLWQVRLQPDRKTCESWLSQLLHLPSIRLEIRNRASGTSQSMKNISKDAFLGISVPIPPFPEQRKIADILSTWDEALEKLDALIQAKERQKKALMQQLLTGKKRVKGFSEPWINCKLGELFKERVEQGRSDLPLLSITANRGVISRGDLTKRDTSSEDKSKYLRIVPGDIGYNTMRMWQGVSALSAMEGIVSPAYTICAPTERIDGRFTAHFFKHPHTIHLFHRYSQGLVDDTLNLKFPSFAVIDVTIPSDIKEQRVIAKILDACDEELHLLGAQREILDQQKRGLMQRLLTGKIRVKTPSEAE